VHVGPDVQTGSPLLLLGGHCSYALLDQVREVLLVQNYTFMPLETVLEVQLEDGPKCLYRVEFGTVGWQVQQFDVQLPGQLADVLGAVGRVVVDDQDDAFVRNEPIG